MNQKEIQKQMFTFCNNKRIHFWTAVTVAQTINKYYNNGAK